MQTDDTKRDAAQVGHNHLRQIIYHLRFLDVPAALEQARYGARVLREMHGAKDLPVVNGHNGKRPPSSRAQRPLEPKRPAPTPRRRK